MFRIKSMRPRIPLLLFGYGMRGRQWERAIRDHDRFRVAGIVDPDEGATSAVDAAEVACCTTSGEALAATEPLAAIVASPPQCHAEQARECLRAGLTVLVEKPLSTTLASAATVADAADAAGRCALVGQNFRFIARERLVQRALPEIGALVQGTISSARPSDVARPHVQTDEYGALWDISLHHLDALRMRFGTPGYVEGHMRSLPSGRPGHVLFDLDLIWSNGARVRYQHSEGGCGFHHTEFLEGRHGAIAVDDQRVYLARSRSRAQRLFRPRSDDPNDVILDALADAVLGKRARQLSARENLRTIAMAEACCRAMTDGGRVALTELTHGARVRLEEVA